MKQFNNQFIVEKWVKIILSVYKGDYYYQKLVSEEHRKFNTNEYINLLKKQIKLLKLREPIFSKVSLNFNKLRIFRSKD